MKTQYISVFHTAMLVDSSNTETGDEYDLVNQIIPYYIVKIANILTNHFFPVSLKHIILKTMHNTYKIYNEYSYNHYFRCFKTVTLCYDYYNISGINNSELPSLNSISFTEWNMQRKTSILSKMLPYTILVY